MQTIDQGLSVLRHFTSDSDEMSLGEISAMSGFDKAKSRRYLMALIKHGYIVQGPGRRYRLGSGPLRLAGIYEKKSRLGITCRPFLRKLRDTTKLTTHLSMLTGMYMSIVYLEEAKKIAKSFPIREGIVLPLHASAAGLSVLAYSPTKFQDAVLASECERLTKSTVCEVSKLRPMLHRIGAAGYHHSAKTFDDRVECVASPVFDEFSMPVGAVAVAFPTGRSIKGQLRPGLARRVVQTAVEISNKIGGRAHEIQTEYLRGSSR